MVFLSKHFYRKKKLSAQKKEGRKDTQSKYQHIHIYIRYTHVYTEILITKKNKNKKQKPKSFKRVKE